MAMLGTTNPACFDHQHPRIRWVVRESPPSLFRRGRIEVGIEREYEADKGGYSLWAPLPQTGGLLSTEECIHLLVMTVNPDLEGNVDARVVIAKLTELERRCPGVVGMSVDLLRGRVQNLRTRLEKAVSDHAQEISRLEANLRLAEQSVRDCVTKGYVATSVITGDGVRVARGDSVFLGTDPERKLILIDAREAMDAERLRIIGLPEGVPVFSRRDRARAWKREHQVPHPTASDAPASPAAARVSASGDGSPDAAAAGDRTELLPIFGEVQPHAC